jgi:hypothetical protein
MFSNFFQTKLITEVETLKNDVEYQYGRSVMLDEAKIKTTRAKSNHKIVVSDAKQYQRFGWNFRNH